jgi:hypothetical protein
MRLRACVPPPHVTVHWLNAPKSGTMQSTGHDWPLHARMSERNGQV